MKRIAEIPMSEMNTLCTKLGVKCFKDKEYQFLHEYCTAMKPLTAALDILQAQSPTSVPTTSASQGEMDFFTFEAEPEETYSAENEVMDYLSGKRKITLMGSHLEFVEGVTHSHAPQEVRPPKNRNHQSLTYDTPAAEKDISTSTVFLKVANETLACLPMTYYPEPEFTSFTSTRTGDDVRITIQVMHIFSTHGQI
ncbi:hypothetical protein PFLUV_G00266440 [Perca fluviatilis]|uniref:Uncharacterized protein n=1 Tax=Perca fluviatilis TaxID=8168 RepID=A0A6A5E2K7_PERFL|nr:hypothetical protein PFLUV_G00266440 [Perca fluviatilis]